MKKIITLSFITLFGLLATSCTDDDVDTDTYSRVIDIQNVSFEWVDNSFQIARTFTTPMYSTDVLLMYIQTDTTTNGAPVWQQIPITFYLNDGNEVDYNFDFSMYDFVIYANGTFNLSGSSYVNNLNFRLVLVPADYLKSGNLDYSDYNSVIQYFEIDDSNPSIL